MNSNMKKSGLGKYAGVHGVVFKNSVEFEKRLKRYERQRQAAAEAAVQANLQQAESTEAIPA